MNYEIYELVDYALETGLIRQEDRSWAINRIGQIMKKAKPPSSASSTTPTHGAKPLLPRGNDRRKPFKYLAAACFLRFGK